MKRWKPKERGQEWLKVFDNQKESLKDTEERVREYKKRQEEMLRKIYIEFGMEARRRRNIVEITLRKMSEKIGVSAPFLSDCELGRRRFTKKHISNYEKVLQKESRSW